MPLYEYECTKCGRRIEVIQKFSDPLRKTCEICKGPLIKLLSAPAIQFKGSGWYVTDYGRGGSGGRKGEGKDSSKDESKDSSKDSSKESAAKDSSESSSTSKKPDSAPAPPPAKKKRG